MVFREDFLQHRRSERAHGHETGLSVIKRFLLVLEYLRHHGVYRAADDKVHPGFRAVYVPDALHVAVHRLVHAEELLELVNEQRDGTLRGKFHQKLEHIGEMLRPSHRGDSQLALYFKPVIFAQIPFCLAGNKEIKDRFVLVCLPYKGCLADTAPSRHYRKLGVVFRHPANLTQGCYFFCPVKKSHILSHFILQFTKHLFRKWLFRYCKDNVFFHKNRQLARFYST